MRGAGVLTALACLLCSCSAGECPTKNDVVALNVDKFVGKWYFLAGTPTGGNSISNCGTIDVSSVASDSFSLNFTAISRRSHRPVTFLANVTTANEVTGTWQLQGSKRILGPFKHRFIAAEYDSYVVLVVCGENNPDLPLHKFSMILARENSIAPATLEALKTKLTPYFDRSVILDGKQTDCYTF